MLSCHECSYAEGEALQRDAALRVAAPDGPSLIALAFRFNPVFTLGRHATPAHLLLDEATLNARGVEIARTDRGGEITYHGPQQLVLYPVFRLDRLGVKQWVSHLEAAMSEWLRARGLEPVIREGVPGVFVGEKKIGFLGLRVRDGVSTHGLSLNLGGDLSPFQWMNPCGYAGMPVTSVEAELGQPCDWRAAGQEMVEILCARLGLALQAAA